MLETGVVPDFIVVDGKEGGTGAAPLEFANHVGMPLVEGLTFVHNTLRGAGIRDRVKIGAAGKLISAFDIARAFAMGADWANSARGFMFSVGCIQAQACHTNHCPVGVATQDKLRQRAVNEAAREVDVNGKQLAKLFQYMLPDGRPQQEEMSLLHYLDFYGPDFLERLRTALQFDDVRHQAVYLAEQPGQ
jgi:glutamate synthase domain-containing protein 2